MDYYPTDIDYYNSIEVLKIKAKFGIIGIHIFDRIIDLIFKEGYFLEWNSDVAIVLANSIGDNVSVEQIEDVVKELMRINFLNQEMYDNKGILTSKKIQEQWEFIIKSSKRKATIDNEYNLIQDEIVIIEKTNSKNPKKTSWENTIHSEEMSINSEGMVLKQEEIVLKKEEMQQIKEKENKENKKCVCEEENTYTHRLNLFIQENHKSILEISEQMTDDECEQIKNMFSSDVIK